MLVMYMLPSVCLRLRQSSQLSFVQYMVLCVFSLPPVMIVRMCTLFYYHHQIRSMNHYHCLGLDYEWYEWYALYVLLCSYNMI